MKGKGLAADFSGRRPRLRSVILVGSALGGVSAGAIPAWAQVPCAAPLVTTSCTNSASLTDTLTIPSAASIGALNNSGTIQLIQTPSPQNGNGIFNDGGDVGLLNNSGTILLSGLHDGYGILNNGGTITTLVNSGFIGTTAKYGMAIFNQSGTISTLNNTGTISGGTISNYTWETYGVSNGGFIGTLNNDGLIESNGSNVLSSGIYEYGDNPYIHEYSYATSETPPPSSQYGIDTLNNNGIIEVSGGQSIGIADFFGTISSLNNAGSINVAGSYSALGIAINDGTTATLDNSGVLDATAAALGIGIASSGPINTLNNTGTINTSGALGAGIANLGGAGYNNIYSTITDLNNSGLIAATGTVVGGIANYQGAIATLDNTGSIQTTSAVGAGIINVGSNNYGTITDLNNSGLIAATGTVVGGIVNYQGAIATLNNTGSLETTGTVGVGILNVGSNNSGTITDLNNSGLIAATGTYVGGIANYQGTITTLTNAGTIDATGSTVSVAVANDQGSITTLDNTGTIETSGTSGGGIVNVGNNSYGTITNLNNSGLIAATGTVVGGIVNYQGAIATLTNAGTIEATGSALGVAVANDQGSITTLDNTGVIKATGSNSFGIGNYGTIGTLNNSGTIAGMTDAIWLATGTLGSLNNSGVIAGTIENDSGQALNITGASGTVYGVLTGYGATPGAAGSLNSRGANVNFTAGHLLLNDNINVGNATVTNSGATLLVNGNIDVTSSQPFMLSGGLMEVGDINNPNASLTSANGLDISGTGILRGHGTVDARVINGGVVYPGGSLGTLNIAGNYTQTSDGTLEIDVTPGGTSQLAVTGTANMSGAIAFNVNAGIYNPGSQYTIITAQSITSKFSHVSYNGSFMALFSHYLTPVMNNPAANITTLVFQPTVLANGSMPAFTTGRFYVGSAYAETNAAQSVLTTPFSSDDNTNNESRGYWLHGIGDFGSANGYNFNSKGFVIGKGFDVSPHLTIGGGLSNVYTTSQAQGSSVDGKSFGVLAYGIYQAGRMTLATSAGIGFLHNKTTRYLPYLDWTTNAANNGVNEGFAAKLQYRLLSTHSRYFLTPYAQTSYIHSSLNGMQEGNQGSLNLYYGRLRTNVTQLGAGAMGGYSLPVKFGQLTAWGSLGGIGTIGNPHASVTEYLGPYTDRQSALAAPIGAFTPALGLKLQGNHIWHISAGWNGQFGSAISANNLTLQLGAIW